MSEKKKPGLMTRLFSSRKLSVTDSGDDGASSKGDKKESKEDKKKRLQRMQTVDPGSLKKRTEDDLVAEALGQDKKKEGEKKDGQKKDGQRKMVKKLDKQKSDTCVGGGSKKSGGGGAPKKAQQSSGKKPRAVKGRAKKKKSRKGDLNVDVDIEKPIDWPAVPEVVLAYHRKKAFLNQNEEWLLVELNEYECLVESLEILKIIAKHSKFFEVEPDELWDEFFEFMEEVPTYDEIVNYDVWQEFRDEKYPY